jgi:hypothetical protein
VLEDEIFTEIASWNIGLPLGAIKNLEKICARFAPSPAQEKPVEASTEQVLRDILDIVNGYGNNPPSLFRVEEYCRAALATASTPPAAAQE